jgi:DNA-binding SARP family transcriptional activator/TolB-like protein/tetratricopeptide (TPR) repeat protein
MTARSYLRLLGGARIDAEADNAPIRGRAAHRRRLALLAILAASPGHRASRERLVALLWPERGSDVARKHLSEALHVIRRELGESVLDAVGDEVLLRPEACGADVIDFQSAMGRADYGAAVAAYAGRFLDGWFVEGAREFEEWAAAEARSLEEQYLRARDELASAAEHAEDWRVAAQHLAAMSRIRAESPTYALRHARCLAASGDRGAAVRVLHAHVRLVEAEELPVDPAIREFEARLRSTIQTNDSSVPVPALPPRPASATPRAPRAIRRRVLIAFGALLLPVLGWLGTRTNAGSIALEIDPRRLAVLYFDHNPRDDLGYLADGLTVRLIDELSSVPELRIASRTAVLHFRQREQMPSLDSVAAALGASVIVEGRVERLGDDVRVTIGLVNAHSLARIGAPQTVVRPADGPLFTLQDDVATALALLLRRQLGLEFPIVVARSGTTSPAAQEFADRATHERNVAWSLVERGTASDLEVAARTLMRADSLLAVAERADVSWRGPMLERGWLARDLARLVDPDAARVLLDSAMARADRALAMGADSAPALELRGVARWQHVVRDAGRADAARLTRLARADLERALSMDSSLVRGAAALAQLARVSARSLDDRHAAMRLARLAFERDAFLARVEGALTQLLRSSIAVGELDSARVWCSRGHALVPYDWRFVECPLVIMRQELQRSTPADAWATVSRLEALDPPERAARSGRPYSPIYRQLVAAAVSAEAGQRDSARAVLARALRAVDGNRMLMHDIKFDEALVRFALGEREEALRSLRQYVTSRPQFLPAVLGERAFRQFGLDSAALASALRIGR